MQEQAGRCRGQGIPVTCTTMEPALSSTPMVLSTVAVLLAASRPLEDQMMCAMTG